MNRINQLFSSGKKDILSIYFCAGTPTLDGTESVIRSLENHGVSMIEIGMPFSDPMADGKVIQNAANDALNNGMSLKLLFEQLSSIRHHVHIPLIIMGYLNPIMQFGFEHFCRQCVDCGIDGCIIPDLPFKEYQEHYRIIAERYNIKVIMLITPETSDERIMEIDQHTSGFIYMVSSASTTGAQQDFEAQKKNYFKRINELKLNNPRMVGFGISNKATFRAACEYSSGGIIGSKFVTLLEELKDPDKAIESLQQALKE
jgi:tryptophan synthase alpha chain